MVKVKRAHKVETLKQTNCYLKLRSPYFYPDHTAPNRSFQQAEEARRKYGGMAVGPAHSRGVAGVMSGGARSSLEGAGGKMQRDEEVLAVH